MLGKRKNYTTNAAPLSVKKLKTKKTSQKLATVATVKRLIANVEEVKHFDAGASATSVDFSGVQWALASIPQGNQDSQRVGDKLKLKDIDVRFELKLGTSPNKFRVLVYQWHDMSGASSPLPISILENTGTVDSPLQPYIWSNKSQYTILRDKTYNLETSVSTMVTDRFFIKRGFRKQVNFTVGSSTLQTNGIFLLAITDDGAVTYPTLAFHSRVRYTDS